MAKKHGSGIVMRIFITLLGAAFIFWGVGLFALGIAGARDTAVITHIRRQGGERNEAVPNRYTYIISYTFKLPNGKNVDAFTTKIGGAVYVKSSNSTVPVRYFAFFPRICALESDTEPHVGQLLYVVIGAFLIYAMNIRKIKGRWTFKSVFK